MNVGEGVIAGEVQLYASPFILKEIRKLPEHPKLRKFRKLSPERIEAFIVELLEVAEIIDEPPIVFDYARDPDDALYVNLAIATGPCWLCLTTKTYSTL